MRIKMRSIYQIPGTDRFAHPDDVIDVDQATGQALCKGNYASPYTPDAPPPPMKSKKPEKAETDATADGAKADGEKSESGKSDEAKGDGAQSGASDAKSDGKKSDAGKNDGRTRH